MIRALAVLVLAAAPTATLAVNRPASDIVMSGQLVTWLSAHDGSRDARERVFDRMHDVDQLDGLKLERLQSDMDRMLLDQVAEITERVMRSDIDDDGKVALDEFVAMNPSGEPDDLRVTFLRYDPDGDGLANRTEVSEAERDLGRSTNAASPLHEIATWDLDGDRIATRDEISAVLAARQSDLWPAE